MLKFFIVFSLLLVSGCVTTKEYVPVAPPPLILTPIDSSLLSDCKLPIQLPEKNLSQKEAEKLWTVDRKDILDCMNKHKALVKVIKFRDEQLTKNK